jgi:hypothetical protein
MEWLKEKTEMALQELKQIITIDHVSNATHQIIKVNGLEAGPAISALSKCLIAVASQIIQSDFQLSVRFLGNTDDRIVVLRNEITALIKATHIDAWIAEAAFFILIAVLEQMHPPGQILAHTLPHTSATRQGLDGTGIYYDSVNNLLGVTISEAKNYDDLNNAVSVSIASFEKIEKDALGGELRTVLFNLEPRIPRDFSELLQGEIWKQSRSYSPVIFFPLNSTYRLDTERKAFEKYVIPCSHKLLILNGFADRPNFYTVIKQEMQTEMSGWLQNV